MKLKNILLILTLCIMALGCKKEDLQLYDSEIAGIFFHKLAVEGSTMKTDSTNFSFAATHSSTKDTILRAQVLTMGKLKDYPRTFKVTIDMAKSTAVEGTHFEIIHNSAVVPAGAEKGYIHVKFKRTDDMSNSKFRLVLKLEDNEHFKPYMEKQLNRRSSPIAPLIDADRFTFIVDDNLTEPNSWKFLRGTYWGNYSAKKYRYINDLLGWTPRDWTEGWVNATSPSFSPIQPRILPAAAALVRRELQALANAGTPMLEENGTKMQLATSYMVFY